MKNFYKIIGISLLMIAGIVTAILAPFYEWLSICLCAILPMCFVAYFCLSVVPKKNKKCENFKKIFALIIIVLTILEIVFYVFFLTGILEHFRDIESAKNWIQSFGAISWIIFFIVQFLQVVILPIPAQVTIIAGVLIFGPLQTFIISSSVVILGSIVCFFIGRLCGNKVLYLLFEKDTADHYRNLLSKRGRILLPLFFLLPIFPDDLLCFASGATSMTFRCFLLITAIFRPVAIACICWVGSGKLIPFSSWGIPVWIVLIILLSAIMFLLFKYQKNLEEWIVNKFSKAKK